jgi:hypothetical protein
MRSQRLALATGFVALLAAPSTLLACGDDAPQPVDPLQADARAVDATVLSDAGGNTDAAYTDSALAADSSDGGLGVDSGLGPPGAPFAGPANTWTYVPMPDLICGNGTTSGVGFNPSSTPNAPVLVFMMGGGACWDSLTCLGGSAANVADAVDEAAIRADITRVDALFDRTAATNPFRDASYVFVPYCTADVHAGNSSKTYSFLNKSITIRHNGANNAAAVVQRLRGTFPAPSKVWLTGASAGGFGALLNYHRFRSAYPAAAIDVLDDSGTPVNLAGSIWSTMQSSWKIVLPPNCPGCTQEVSKLLPALAVDMRQDKLAIATYTQDRTIRSFSGNLVAADFERQVLALRGTLAANQKMFLIAGDSHVLLKERPLPTTSGGVTFVSWVQQFAAHAPAWQNEGP